MAVGVLVRQGRFRLFVLCSAPFALNLIAAAIRRFPYGGHMRLTMHVVPLVCILAGIGAAAVLKRPGAGKPMSRPVVAALVALLMLAVLSVARDFCLPGKEQQEIRRRDFAVWFWGSMEREHEVVCINSDLKQIFAPPNVWRENCVSAQFLCNEQIYSPRHACGQTYDLGRVSRQRPLACVQFWTHLGPTTRRPSSAGSTG